MACVAAPPTLAGHPAPPPEPPTTQTSGNKDQRGDLYVKTPINQPGPEHRGDSLRHLHPVPDTRPAGRPPVADQARSVTTQDGPRGRRVQVGTGPATIRVLAAELDNRLIPDTYVTDGAPVVVEAVSGAPGPVAGDADAPLPLAVTPLRPPLLASLLAEHATVVRVEARQGQRDLHRY